MRSHEYAATLRANLDHIANDQGLWSDHGACLLTDDDALLDAVRAAVATALTDKQREAVEMHFFCGLSQGEIARQLAVTQQVVQKRIYGVSRSGRTVGGALARLREVLAPTVLERGRLERR